MANVPRVYFQHSRNGSDRFIDNSSSPHTPSVSNYSRGRSAEPLYAQSNHSPSNSMTFSHITRDTDTQRSHNHLVQTLEATQLCLEDAFHDVELLSNTVEAFQETLHQASVQSILSNSPENTTPQMAGQTSENLLRTLIPALRQQTHVFEGESKGKFRTAVGKLNRLLIQLLREKAELMLNNVVAVQQNRTAGHSNLKQVLQSAISQEELQREMDALTERHESVASQFLHAEELNTALKDELSRLREDVTELHKQIETRDEKLQIAHAQHSHMRRDMKRLAQEVTSLRGQNEQLQQDHESEVETLKATHAHELSEKTNALEQFVSHSQSLQTMSQFFGESVTNATMEALTVTCPTMNTSELCDMSNKTLSELSDAIDEKNQSLQQYSDAPACVKEIGMVLYNEITQRIRLTKLLNISCWTEIQVGDYVMLSEGRTGEVKYVGPIEGKPPELVWYGIELSLPVGVHNGTLNGRKYFRSPPHCGVFVLRNRVLRILEQKGDMIKMSNRDVIELQGQVIKLERTCEEQAVQIRALDEIRQNLSSEVLMLSQQHRSLLEQNESMMSLNKHLKLQVRDFLKKEAENLSKRNVNHLLSPSESGFGRLSHRSETFDESSRHFGFGDQRDRLTGYRSATFAHEDSCLTEPDASLGGGY